MSEKQVTAAPASALKLHIDPEAPRDILAEDGELVATAYNPIGFAGGQYGNDTAAVALARQFAGSSSMKEGLLYLLDVMRQSAGVAGFNLNGALLTWEEFAANDVWRAAVAAAESKQS